jgi:hypothetical protein
MLPDSSDWYAIHRPSGDTWPFASLNWLFSYETGLVRVLELREGARLALETLAQLGIGGDVGRQHLERHGPIQARVARLVDLTHAAGAGERLDLVGSDERAGGEGHRGRP